jgi:hypothetical protein
MWAAASSSASEACETQVPRSPWFLTEDWLGRWSTIGGSVGSGAAATWTSCTPGSVA